MPTETINQSSYLIGATKETIIPDVFKTFWSILGKYVHPTTDKFWYPSFPFRDLNSGSLSYPVGILESPEFSNEKFTIEKKFYMGSILVEIYATSSEKADEYIQGVLDAIDSEEQTLWTLNLRMVKLEGMSQDFVLRNEAAIHIRRARYSFRYTYKRGLYGG